MIFEAYKGIFPLPFACKGQIWPQLQNIAHVSKFIIIHNARSLPYNLPFTRFFAGSYGTKVFDIYSAHRFKNVAFNIFLSFYLKSIN